MGLSRYRLRKSLDILADQDADIAAVLAELGYPQLRHREPGFATLFQVIVAQQISTKAAAAIWRRVTTAWGEQPQPVQILTATDAQLRECGLSTRKAEYAQGLAAMVADGRLPLETMAALDDEAAIAAITAVRGLGRWSAEIYLLFAEGRPDVWPADDLAIQIAYQRLKKLDDKPKGKAFYAMVESWSPHRGAAAMLLWKYYGAATLQT